MRRCAAARDMSMFLRYRSIGASMTKDPRFLEGPSSLIMQAAGSDPPEVQAEPEELPAVVWSAESTAPQAGSTVPAGASPEPKALPAESTELPEAGIRAQAAAGNHPGRAGRAAGSRPAEVRRIPVLLPLRERRRAGPARRPRPCGQRRRRYRPTGPERSARSSATCRRR